MRASSAAAYALRPETPDDRAFVAALFADDRAPGFIQAGLPEAMVRPLIEQQFRLQSQHLTSAFPDLDRQIVVSGGEPIGRLYVDRSPLRWHIAEIAVAAAWRGHGFATRLIRDLGQQAQAAGVCAIELQVARDNVAAISLYRRLGFAEIGGISATHSSMRWEL